jgi:hypothetical protein
MRNKELQMTKNLTAYVAQKNAMALIFGEAKIEFPLTQWTATKLVSALYSDLSPENLCCDGELRGPMLAAKSKMLNGALKELQTYAKANGLSILSESEIFC